MGRRQRQLRLRCRLRHRLRIHRAFRIQNCSENMGTERAEGCRRIGPALLRAGRSHRPASAKRREILRCLLKGTGHLHVILEANAATRGALHTRQVIGVLRQPPPDQAVKPFVALTQSHLTAIHRAAGVTVRSHHLTGRQRGSRPRYSPAPGGGQS